MIIKTGRFGQVTIGAEEKIHIPQGILGFPELRDYCLIDPGDETLIVWLQSLTDPALAFPVLEPKIFFPQFAARLSGMELRELRLDNVNQSAVFSILTIPADVTQMTANLKAPLVVNLREQVAKQVVLQENEYSIRHLMFKELKTDLMTIRASRAAMDRDAAANNASPIRISTIPPSLTVKALQA